MRIAYVRDTLYPFTKGGAQKRLYDIAKSMAQKGHDVHVFGYKYWEGSDTITQDGVTFHGICEPLQLFSNSRRTIMGPLIFSIKLISPLFKSNFDIIDCDSEPYFHCFSVKAYSVIKRKPMVITWIEVWGDYWYEYLGKLGVLGQLVEKLTCSLTRHNVSISNHTAQRLERLYRNHPIAIIPCGIDIQKITQIPQSHIKSDVIYVGRLIQQKHIDILIKAIHVAKSAIPSITCIIVGDGPEKERLVKLVTQLNLESNVLFLGFLEEYDDVIAYMKSSKIFVLPSTREGFGIVVLEANACGLPVIVINSDQNAAKDLIQGGKNGYICSLSDEEVGQRIAQTLRNQYGEVQKQQCMEQVESYDWEKITDDLEDIYKKIILKGCSDEK